ncbi:MAG: Sec-independent protein translocase subunit TatA [Proteobacteria bacterium]|nr:Sec-independent protein translocase subunit TatA [Pseudomonadota bacterium]
MLSNIGPVQLLIVLAIVLAIFGTKRLRTLGSDLGSAVKGFRSAVNDADKANETDESQDTTEQISESSEDANFDNTPVEKTHKENSS